MVVTRTFRWGRLSLEGENPFTDKKAKALVVDKADIAANNNDHQSIVMKKSNTIPTDHSGEVRVTGDQYPKRAERIKDNVEIVVYTISNTAAN